jgi:hypothetical protein
MTDSANGRTIRRSQVRQELILSEMIHRVRTHLGFSSDLQEGAPPLIVVITKADAWSHLLGDVKFDSPWRLVGIDDSYCALDMPAVLRMSAKCRKLLEEMVPEFIGNAEQLTRNVLYIPVSATGIAPSINPETGALGFRPDDLRPFWVEVPILCSLALQTRGMIPQLRHCN